MGGSFKHRGGFTLIELLVLMVGILAFLAYLHGIYLAFAASILLGIICIFLEVPFFIFGITYWFAGVDLAQTIVHALPQIFH